MARIILDTCAVIWTGNDEKMSSGAVTAIDQCHSRNEKMLVSPVTAWELGLLVSKGRYRFTMNVAEWFTDYMDNVAVEPSKLTSDDLIASSFLPGKPPNDPADRMIIATARQYGYRIMTRDAKILDYAAEGYVNAIAC